MSTETKIIVYAFFLGICIWAIDGLFLWRFTPTDDLAGAILTDVPTHRLYLRSLILAALGVFGWLVASSMRRQRRAEENLRRVQHRLELILESAHEGIYGTDLQGNLTFVNKAAAEALGYDPEEMLGRNAHELFHHSRADGTRLSPDECPMRLATESRTHVRVTDEAFWTRDGEAVRVHYSAMPITDDGERRGTVIVFRPITEEEAAREELERLRRLSQLILTWAGEGIFGVDLSGRITFANPAAGTMLGFEPDELGGRRAHDLVQHTRADGSLHPEEQSLIYAAFRDDDVYHVSDEVFWRRSGDFFPVEYTSTPLREAGELVGAVVVFQDITERKNAERELRETLRELARSNRELEQFAYVVSHDLQEPLRMVQSYVELLRRRYGDRLEDDAQEFLDFALSGARRMQRMVEDLLRYSRLDSRGGEMAPTDLDEVMQEVEANLRTAIEESGAEIRAEKLPTVVADRSQMVQLLQNLISNAIKFRGDDAPLVEIRSVRQNGHYLISVSDNGIGIPAEQVERVFAIFQRLHSQDRYPGTGIGLAICRKIVERHGGRIWVESEPGEGTTFFFTLTAAEASVQIAG